MSVFRVVFVAFVSLIKSFMPLLVISTIVPVLNSGEMNGKHVTPTQLTSLFDARLKVSILVSGTPYFTDNDTACRPSQK